MTQILNLTPHDIHIVDENGNVTHTFSKSGDVLRLEVLTSPVVGIGQDCPIAKREVTPIVFKSHDEWEQNYNEVEDTVQTTLSWSGFEANGIKICGMYDGIIVAAQVAAQLALQGDCPFEVYTVGDTVKDSNGAIIGTKFLVLN